MIAVTSTNQVSRLLARLALAGGDLDPSLPPALAVGTVREPFLVAGWVLPNVVGGIISLATPTEWPEVIRS